MSMQGEGQGHAPRRSLLFTPPASLVLASRYLSAGILLPLIAADHPDPPSLNECHASVVQSRRAGIHNDFVRFTKSDRGWRVIIAT